MGEFILNIIAFFAGLVVLYFFRKIKPAVDENMLVFKSPLLLNIFLFGLFLLCAGATVFSVVDNAGWFAIIFCSFFTFLIATFLPLAVIQFSISKDLIIYRNGFFIKKTFRIDDLQKIDYTNNIGLLVFDFPNGKAKFSSGFGGSQYFFPVILSRFEDKITQKARKHIEDSMFLQSIPLI